MPISYYLTKIDIIEKYKMQFDDGDALMIYSYRGAEKENRITSIIKIKY